MDYTPFNFTTYRGADYAFGVSLANKLDNSPYDLTNHTIEAKLTRGLGGPSVGELLVSFPSPGRIVFKISNQLTSSLAAFKYNFAALLVRPDDFKIPLVRGEITIKP